MLTQTRKQVKKFRDRNNKLVIAFPCYIRMFIDLWSLLVINLTWFHDIILSCFILSKLSDTILYVSNINSNYVKLAVGVFSWNLPFMKIILVIAFFHFWNMTYMQKTFTIENKTEGTRASSYDFKLAKFNYKTMGRMNV